VRAIDPQRLEGRWVHSHEEDTAEEMVFRSADAGFEFPRSRGRQAFELRPDGSYLGSVPGPADKPEPSEGTWALEGENRLALPDRVLEITEAEGDVLKVRK
jgi:hypothetical protein